LFTKEPCTIEWLDNIKPGEVLYDIGANVGSYSVYAGVRGVKVYSFEPEADNYALLTKNLTLNGIKENAYCLALSNEDKFGMLNLSQRGAGGSCHNFSNEDGKIQQGCMAIRLMGLFELGLPVPDHIKIDVDGNEFDVIKGLGSYIQDVKSIIVEIDPNSSEHSRLIETLLSNGYVYSETQVNQAMRKEGSFKGYAEYIFRNNKFLEEPLKFPYPFFIVDNLFPKEDYPRVVEISRNATYLSLEEARGTKGYPERYVAKLDKEEDSLIRPTIEKLKSQICKLFNLDINDYEEDLLLINDKPGYRIGVHRDRPDKVVTALIYLPKDSENAFAGTTVYKPKQEGFTCQIGKHYGFEEFDKVTTVDYVPNSAFVFLNTDSSFHGVEPCSAERHVLLLNLNKKK
jgi:FkbM family methyltransferase